VTTLAPFELHRAGSIAEATSLMDELGEEAALYAGGTELLLLMKLGFAAYGHLVDVKGIPELRELGVVDGALRIGGAVTHRGIERSPLVREGWPDLAGMERWVANLRVRCTGSLGGNLAFADPHSDPATFLLAAGGVLHLGRGATRRSLPIEAFVLGPYTTALEPGELVLAIEVPPLDAGAAMTHVRFAVHERPAATLAAQVHVVDGLVSGARLAVGSVGVVPVLVPEADSALLGRPAVALDAAALAAVGEAAAEVSAPVADSNGAEDYKRALVRVLSGRVLREAAGRALERAAA
jgi:aerobic carbon-monoxide dehydrogenase medium subunit